MKSLAHLVRRDLEGPKLDAASRIDPLPAWLAVEHARGEHGQEEQQQAHRDALRPREATLRGPRNHRDPEVAVCEILFRFAVEKLADLGHLVCPGHRDQAINLKKMHVPLKKGPLEVSGFAARDSSSVTTLNDIDVLNECNMDSHTQRE